MQLGSEPWIPDKQILEICHCRSETILLTPNPSCEGLLKRDKLSLDLFWIRDKTLTDTDSLPPPDIIAAEIADDLEAALEQFTKIAARLGKLATSHG
jgi:hypothetical protein